MRVKNIIVVLLFAFVAACSSPEDKITNTVLEYFHAESNEDYYGTAKLTNPHQMEKLKNGVLPLFIKAKSSSKHEFQHIASQFFDGVAHDKQSTLNKVEVYARLMRVMNRYKRKYIAFIQTASVEIKNINKMPQELAEVEVILTNDDTTVPITIQLELIEGNWYIQMASSPEETINKFKTLFDES